ncbi:hypothetical protein BDP81DRAFT_517855 [Colletotrichum phormii]|uniref:Uncharacterized protein n=1 Tax=Colletotrichum phormii TaxID=359342 RepID=A0AAI9ZUA3_9PEZI|nr:uncharacterized protein BDP81DRAFT_517855 [Colletotrichum phormii]KAK1637965.1 hypothetical protein BDP81DRAFT_517855 [Colletotrichum phormii]
MKVPTALLLALLGLTSSAIADGGKKNGKFRCLDRKHYLHNVGKRYREECTGIGSTVGSTSATGHCRITCDHLPTYAEWAKTYEKDVIQRKLERELKAQREKQRMEELAKKLGVPPIPDALVEGTAAPPSIETEETSPEEPANVLSPRFESSPNPEITTAPTPKPANVEITNTSTKPCKPKKISGYDPLCTLTRRIPRYSNSQAAHSSSLQAEASYPARASRYSALLIDAKPTAVEKTATVTATVEKLVTKCTSSVKPSTTKASTTKATTHKAAGNNTTPTPTTRQSSVKKQTAATSTATTSSAKATKTVHVASEGSCNAIIWSMLVAWIGVQVLFLTVM